MLIQLANTTWTPRSRAPSVFHPVDTATATRLVLACDLRKHGMNYFNAGTGEIRVPDTSTLEVSGDRTNTIPMIPNTGAWGPEPTTKKYGMFLLRDVNGDVFVGADDRQQDRMAPQHEVQRLVNAILQCLASGNIDWDIAQPIIADNPDEHIEYDTRFAAHLTRHENLPTSMECDDPNLPVVYDFVKYGSKQDYRINDTALTSIDVFGEMMGALPIIEAAQVQSTIAQAKSGGNVLEYLDRSIGFAALTFWNFWNSGKVPEQTQLFQGDRRQIGFNFLPPKETIKVDQIVHGTFNSLHVGRTATNSYTLWCTFGRS